MLLQDQTADRGPKHRTLHEQSGDAVALRPEAEQFALRRCDQTRGRRRFFDTPGHSVRLQYILQVRRNFYLSGGFHRDTLYFINVPTIFVRPYRSFVTSFHAHDNIFISVTMQNVPLMRNLLSVTYHRTKCHRNIIYRLFHVITKLY